METGSNAEICSKHAGAGREQERIVREELDAGRFRSEEELIGAALQGLREREVCEKVAGTDQNGAVHDTLVFVEKNRVELKGVTVRRLIEEGRRL